MPRPAHSWFRRSDGWWYVKISGKPEKLTRGREHKDTAFQRWHELMAERAMNRPAESSDQTVASVIDLQNKNHQHQVHRPAVRRALLEVGLLTVARRSIPLLIQREKRDKIS